jgi:hypothetical protein
LLWFISLFQVADWPLIKIIILSATDITKPVDLSIHAKGTGPKRFRRPVYVDFMPQCNSACPAGENIQAWMAYAQQLIILKHFKPWLKTIPSLRVCVKPCEIGCNRFHIDTTVNIHAVLIIFLPLFVCFWFHFLYSILWAICCPTF